MPEIVLTTLNARYAHAAFGLRYLMANLGEMQSQAKILEFDINQRPVDILEGILAEQPRVVGLGVYIWNVVLATQLVADLKRVRPDIVVILGGPEVSHELDQQEIVRLADYVITGEADLAFAELCVKVLAGRKPLMKVIPAELPEFFVKQARSKSSIGLSAAAPTTNASRHIALPYSLYTPDDIAHRVIYVEASRGCPFTCEFCLSSLDVPVRSVPLEPFLEQMQRLLDRGTKQFKFVDRTFNLNLNFSRSILEFFFERYTPGLFLHFEMIPDRLPEALRETIRKFPPGALQFEVGIQTFNEEVGDRISRRQDNVKLADNLRFLREETGVHVHADLIVGLPGEDMESFGAGFDRLIELRPQEIQVGMLKRLRGTPIARHDSEWKMVYSPHPPYEVLQTGAIDFQTMQRLRRFSRFWDLIGNSGNFTRTLPLIWSGTSPFRSFLKVSDWFQETLGRTHGIALPVLAERLFEFLTEVQGVARETAAAALWEDIRQGGRRDAPEFLKQHVSEAMLSTARRCLPTPTGPKRQSRHLEAAAPLSPPAIQLKA